MPIFYLSYIYTFFLLSYVREKNIRNLLFPLLLPLIVLFSFRSAPDEYARYLELAVPNSFWELGFGLNSEWIFNLICQICKIFPNPLTLLYLISYSLIFYLINKSILLISNKSYAISFFSTGFYLSHLFITFFEGIRGGLANIITLFAICIFIKTNHKLKTIILLYLAASIHIQTLPFFLLFILFIITRYIFKKIKLLEVKQKQILNISFLTLVIVISIISRSLFAELFNWIIIKNASFFGELVGYIGDNINLYEINLLSSKYVALIFTNFVILFFTFQPIFSNPNKRYRILFFMVLFGQIISLAFSSLALVAYRISSSFLYFQIPLIASSIQKRNIYKFNNRKILFILLAIVLSFYNIFLHERLKSFAF